VLSPTAHRRLLLFSAVFRRHLPSSTTPGRPLPEIVSYHGARRPSQWRPSCEFTDEEGLPWAVPSPPGLLAVPRRALPGHWKVENTAFNGICTYSSLQRDALISFSAFLASSPTTRSISGISIRHSHLPPTVPVLIRYWLPVPSFKPWLTQEPWCSHHCGFELLIGHAAIRLCCLHMRGCASIGTCR